MNRARFEIEAVIHDVGAGHRADAESPVVSA